MPAKPCALSVAAIATSVLLGTPIADAHWSASYSRSLFVERYLVCDGDLDVRCVGPIAARDELLADLELGPIEVDRNNDHVVDPAREAAVFAAYFDMREAIGPLRTMLVLPMPPGAKDTHTELEIHALRAEAAYALAELGDERSIAPITALAHHFETEGHGFLWGDTVTALTRLSPAAGAAYGRDFLSRMQLSDTRMSMPGGGSQLVVLDPILRAQDRLALPVLRRLTAREDATSRGAPRVELADAHTWCRLMGTRLGLGEQPLVTDVRKAFGGSYSGTMVATCDGEFLRAYGGAPQDAEILLRHLGRDDLGFDAGMSLVAYDRLIALVAGLRGAEGRAASKARKTLLAGLRERSAYPHVADPTHRNFGTHFVALHQAALAGLGDAEAAAVLHAMIVAPDDVSGVADLAALRAIQVGVPGALDDAAVRLTLDLGFANDERSGIFEDLRVRLLDAFVAAAPSDPRWAVALVDAERDVRERAFSRHARLRPPGTCAAVIPAAAGATERGIDEGFLVLTTQGDGCRAEFDRAIRDDRAPVKVRGMALEALAILRVAVPRAVIDQARSADGMAVHLQRVAAIREALSGRPLAPR